MNSNQMNENNKLSLWLNENMRCFPTAAQVEEMLKEVPNWWDMEPTAKNAVDLIQYGSISPWCFTDRDSPECE